LLLAVAPDAEDRLVEALEREGTPARAVIGEIVDGPPGHLEVIA
jgi:hydrogenase maturation factor